MTCKKDDIRMDRGQSADQDSWPATRGCFLTAVGILSNNYYIYNKHHFYVNSTQHAGHRNHGTCRIL